jgi:hypothetical protein
MLLGILVYGYATGVFSSRKLERAARRSFSIISASASIPEARQKFSKLAVICKRFDLDRSRRNRSVCDKPVHGVAFPCWNQYREPTSSR